MIQYDTMFLFFFIFYHHFPPYTFSYLHSSSSPQQPPPCCLCPWVISLSFPFFSIPSSSPNTLFPLSPPELTACSLPMNLSLLCFKGVSQRGYTAYSVFVFGDQGGPLENLAPRTEQTLAPDPVWASVHRSALLGQEQNCPPWLQNSFLLARPRGSDH